MPRVELYTAVLAKNSDDLNPKSLELLRSLVSEALLSKEKIQFLGYNDDFPSMANVVATLGGEQIGDEDARQRGIDGMHRLLELLGRRDFLCRRAISRGVHVHAEVGSTQLTSEAQNILRISLDRLGDKGVKLPLKIQMDKDILRGYIL